jgi:hypothetical protein
VIFLIHPGRSGREIPVPDADVRDRLREREALRTLLQRFLGDLPRRDVFDIDDDAADLAGLLAPGAELRAHPVDLAMRRRETILVAK